MDTGKKAAENIARRHIEFIKSGGEKGCSITPPLLKAFEKIEESYPNVLGTLRAEYYFIEALASAMKAEIERMEEES